MSAEEVMGKPNNALSKRDISWLVKLSQEIWEKHKDVIRANLSGHEIPSSYQTEKRKLTSEEFERVKALILKHELPCMPGSGTFGFGFSLTVFDHSPLPQVQPDPLIRITDKHLPGIEPGHENWGMAWDAFKPFTHSPRNKELLAFYGMKAPGKREDYEY